MADATVALTGKLLTVGRGTLTPPNTGTVAKSLSGYSFSSVGGALARITLINRYRFSAFAYNDYTLMGVRAELSGYTFTARGGALARLTAPKATFASGATVTVYGSFAGVLSGYGFSSTGVQDIWGKATLTYYGTYLVTARGGAKVAVALSGYSLSTSGRVDKIARFAGTMPQPTLVAHGFGDNLGQVVGILPTLKAGIRAVAIGTLPRATVSITGSAVSVEYEAYSFALFDDERTGMQAFATHYTTFPFDRIVRYNNKHYGVAVDGLYELGGNDFNGTPIVGVVVTHPTDFKARELKRPVSLYLGGRVSADFRVSVIDSETDTNAYNYRPVDKTGARNYRTFFGKGIRARYLAYALTNTNGGDFMLDDITPEVVVLRRTA
jgi:hypothetical protein